MTAPTPTESGLGTPGPADRLWVRLGLILLLALALRLLLILQMGNRAYFADTLEYQAAAQNLLAGHGPGRNFPRAPVYPAFMALGLLLSRRSYTGVRMLQLVLGLGVVALSAVLARRIGSRRTAVVTALFAALAPTLVFTTGMLYPTVLYTLLIGGITWAALEIDRRQGAWWGVAFGAFASLALMTDQIAAAPIGATALWLLAGFRGRARRLAVSLGAAVLVIAAVLVPISRYYERAYGRAPIFMEKAQVILWFVRSDPSLAGIRAVHDTTSHFRPLNNVQFVRREWDLLRKQPLAYGMDFLSEFVHFFKPMPDRIRTENVYTGRVPKVVAGLYFVPVLLLAMIGMAAGPARRRDRLLLACAPLATAAAYSLFFTQLRYRIPVEPQLLILASLGGSRLLPELSRTLAGGAAEPVRGPAPVPRAPREGGAHVAAARAEPEARP